MLLFLLSYFSHIWEAKDMNWRLHEPRVSLLRIQCLMGGEELVSMKGAARRESVGTMRATEVYRKVQGH